MNENINISSTISRMNDLCKNLHIDFWKFYNFLVSGYPSIEIDHPCFFMKRFDGTFIGTPVGDFDDVDLDIDDIPYYDFKKDTWRWDIRDKAQYGSKGKKINDINGEHWTRIHVINPKKKKAIEDQIQQDIQNMKDSQEWEVFISDLGFPFYEQVKYPATKTFEQVLGEVYDMFNFVDLNNYIMGTIEKEVLKYYKEDVEKVNICLNKLHDAINELKTAERRINYYVSLLSKYGIDMET